MPSKKPDFTNPDIKKILPKAKAGGKPDWTNRDITKVLPKAKKKK